MDDNKTKSEIAYLKKELAKVNKELAKSKACEMKRKSDLEDVKSTLRKERNLKSAANFYLFKIPLILILDSCILLKN